MADVEAAVCKFRQQLIGNSSAISNHRLFDHVVKQLLDKCLVSGFSVRGKLRHIACSGQLDRLPTVSLEFAAGFDRLVLIRRAPATDPVVVLQAETERINRCMAGHTSFRTG